MKKLSLNLDALQVQSFETDGAAPGAGTVRAHALAPSDRVWSNIENGCLRTYYTGCLTCPVDCTAAETCYARQCGL